MFQVYDKVTYKGGSYHLDQLGCINGEVFAIVNILAINQCLGIKTNTGHSAILINQNGGKTEYYDYFELYEDLSTQANGSPVTINLPPIPKGGYSYKVGGVTVGQMIFQAPSNQEVENACEELRAGLTKIFKGETKCTEHDLQTYYGFTESYRYCTKCDHKEH